ncbi:hypothetical protein CC80DRAFT_548623 [Byssothecium circinans]|uniref:Fungal calcium binding protein domain-containing protein n=1 Tax=Byssothecium circinans TaxID=147558 RepID=A0A6A5TUL0_9PLEO|nr:hypothetical protein CC80DRAFT_548623 [Byssothecium circinans]
MHFLNFLATLLATLLFSTALANPVKLGEICGFAIGRVDNDDILNPLYSTAKCVPFEATVPTERISVGPNCACLFYKVKDCMDDLPFVVIEKDVEDVDPAIQNYACHVMPH